MLLSQDLSLSLRKSLLNLEEDLTFLTDHKAWNEISLGELGLEVERSPGP